MFSSILDIELISLPSTTILNFWYCILYMLALFVTWTPSRYNTGSENEPAPNFTFIILDISPIVTTIVPAISFWVDTIVIVFVSLFVLATIPSLLDFTDITLVESTGFLVTVILAKSPLSTSTLYDDNSKSIISI